MTFFDKSDLQFVVFCPVDNTVHVMAKSRVEFQNDEDGSVVVMWQTSDIGDDGKMILKEMPYDGFIVFSGSLQKCRGYEKKIQEEILEKNNGKETSASVSEMRNLSEEMRKSGKRGSSLKLKRMLEKEKDESNKKAKKSNKSKPTSKPVHQSKPSASRKLSELKLKELEAFAGIQSQQKSPVKPLSQKTPSKSLQKTPSKKTPSKSPQKTPSKSLQKTPSKSLQKSPVKWLPQKSPSKSLQKTPSKSLQKTPSKFQKTPCKSLQKSQFRSPLQKSPSKSTLQNSSSKLLLQNSPLKSLPQKFPSNLPQKLSSKSLQKSPSKSIHNKMPKSPRKTPVMKEYQESTSFIIGQGLGILNDDENFHDHHIDSAMEFEDMPDPSFHEYGYNAGMHVQTETNQGQSDFKLVAPVENLIGYYRSLSFEQQSGILSFLHLLTNTLQNSSQTSASGSTSIPVHTACYTPNFETPGSSSQTVDQVTPSAKELRKLPLINDENNTYSDVLVNPSQLRTAEMKSLTATKNGSIYLLNKIVEMVFTRDELKASKGVRGLDKHKLEAIQEYMHTKCRKLQLDPIPPKSFNKTIQNKIGNLRHETKGKATLV